MNMIAVVRYNFRQVIACIDYIAKLPDKQLSKEKKLEFFAETRHAFGRSAVLFSGRSFSVVLWCKM